jgi:DNA polymerase III subunit beta
MKITVEQSTLLKSLAHVHRVVERRNTIPILSNVLMRAAGGSLQLKATDLDIEVVETMSAESGMDGAITVPAHTLYDIVRKLSDGSQVSLETGIDGAQMVIRSGRSRFTLQTLPEQDFPDMAASDLSHRFKVSSKELQRLIEKTQFAISTEETRYYLNGIYMHTVETDAGLMLRAVATDGHRLARSELPAPSGAAGMTGIIVPRKTVAEVLKLVADHDGDVAIELSTAKIRFLVGNLVLTSKLIDGTFPDYTRVIPVANDKRMTVERAEFTRSVDRVSTISSERGRAVKLSAADGKLTLSVTNPDAGNAVEEIEADYDAASIDIGFNARYLLDIMGQLEGDTTLVKLADPSSPTLILDREGASTLYVLMPMRV